MTKQVTACDVALYFLLLSEKANKRISNKKLQKLVYYAQAWTLALTGKSLFSEKIEAWIHGPAIPSLYRKYKKYGFHPIDCENSNPNISNTKILDEVWRVYSKYDADYLEVLTHQEDPWIHARDELEYGESSSSEISRKSMQDYYTKILSSATDNEK